MIQGQETFSPLEQAEQPNCTFSKTHYDESRRGNVKLTVDTGNSWGCKKSVDASQLYAGCKFNI
jgi:hypothetical protein